MRYLHLCIASILIGFVASSGFADETDEEKIRAALAAAPAKVSADATVLDWPETPSGGFRVLRKGSGNWTCLPDMPGDAQYEPSCNDEEWMNWMRAFQKGEEPKTRRLGVSYMLNSRWALSNTDPTATEPAADNEWVAGGAHLMIIVPDPAMLDGYPDDPGPGAYVMWKGTPWVHLMVPMEELVENER